MSHINALEIFRKEVKETIEKEGIYILGKSSACDCEKCKAEGITKDKNYNDIFDGYAHSIGFHEKGLPEILILTGSNGVEEGDLTKEQLLNRTQDAINFINTIYHTRDTFIFDKNKAYGSPNINGLYWVILDDELIQSEEFIKHDLMNYATQYYDDCQYKVIIFKPHIHF